MEAPRLQGWAPFPSIPVKTQLLLTGFVLSVIAVLSVAALGYYGKHYHGCSIAATVVLPPSLMALAYVIYKYYTGTGRAIVETLYVARPKATTTPLPHLPQVLWSTICVPYLTLHELTTFAVVSRAANEDMYQLFLRHVKMVFYYKTDDPIEAREFVRRISREIYDICPRQIRPHAAGLQRLKNSITRDDLVSYIINLRYYPSSPERPVVSSQWEIFKIIENWQLPRGFFSQERASAAMVMILRCHREDVDMLRLLLKNGANPNIPAGKITVPGHRWSLRDRNWGFREEVPGLEGEYPLHEAAVHGYTASVSLLLQYHADVTLKNVRGETALEGATKELGVIEDPQKRENLEKTIKLLQAPPEHTEEKSAE